MENQRAPEKTIPVFTVLKNGAILKNIFVVNNSSPDFSSPEAEEILLVGRHPDCDILLTHPSISRFHLQIRSLPSRQKLFVTDLSSVHGTWVADQKVEPDACVEVKEGDVIRIGGSTRIYRLHWIPLSRVYDTDNPFVPPSTPMEQDEELEAENLVVAHQSGDDGDGHLDVTSEGSGSSVVPSEDEDTTREVLLPVAPPRDSVNTEKLQSNEDLQTSSKLELDAEEAAAEMPISSSYPEALACYEPEVPAEANEWGVRGDGGMLLDVMSEMIESSVPNGEEDPYLQFTDVVQASPELSVNIIEANTEKSSSCSSLRKSQIDGVFEDSENQMVALQSLADSGDDGDGHLYVTSEGSGSSVLSEDEDTTREVLLPAAPPSVSSSLPRDSVNTEKLQSSEDLQTSSKGELDVEEAAAEMPITSCGASKPQSDSYPEALACSELEVPAEADEWDVRGDGGLLLDMMPEMIESPVPNGEDDPYLAAKETSSFPLPRDSTETEELQLTDVVQASAELTVNIIEANTEYSSSCSSLRKSQIGGVFEDSGRASFELAAEVETLSLCQEVCGENECDTKQVMEVYAEPLTEAENQIHVDNEEIEVSPSSSSQSDRLIEILTEDGISDDALSQMNSSRSGKSAFVPLLEAPGCSAYELSAEVEIMSPRQEVSEEIGFVTEKIQEASTEPLTKADVQSHEENGVTEVFTPVIEVSSCPQIEPKLVGDARGLLDSEVAIEADSQNLHKKSNRETRISSSEVSIVSDCLFAGKTEDIQSLWSSRQLLPEGELGDPSEILSEVNLAGDQNKISAMSRETEQIFDDGRSSCHPEEQKQSGAQRFLLTPNQESKTEISFGSGKSEESYSLSEIEGEGYADKEDTKPTQKLPSDYTGSQENQSPQTLAVRYDVLSEMDSSRSSSRRLSTNNIWSRRGKAASVLQVRTNKSEGKQKQIGKPKAQLQRKLEPEIFTPDKENLTPNSHMLKRLREVGEIKDTKGSSSKAIRKPFFDTHVEENVMVEQKQDAHCMSSNSKVAHEPMAQKKKAERAPFQHLLDKSSSQSQSYTEASSTAAARTNISWGLRSSSNLSDGKNKMKWTIVLDTSSLLNKESRKPLHLLQGLKGTHMVVPRTVLRELNEMKRGRCLLFSRTAEMASSALDWIEECKVSTKWWIQLQSPSEETKATAPTPPVTSQSNGYSFPFSLDWNSYAPEIDSPTSEDQVLECALLHRNRNRDVQLVLLSNDVTLKIKAMAEGVMCETAHEFYESLKNPYSERFMWPESLPRGRTWSHEDDTVLRERYDNRKLTFNGGRRGEIGATAAKGLKLILLYNSQYGHIR
ncbi:BnaA10g09600D [Brassica napus]|uniref:BnaA10g09600D protein n=1 Tax=Brassica napus TaxID=3708 RepID=A0A078FWJ5_BRANA|nr:BnaA10g09600D [Brassica napus]